MPVWNGARYLRDAIDSLLRQTHWDFELIVVDDGSTDNSADIISGLSDSRIRYERLGHGGVVSALNRGLALARGEFIARQDADDLSLASRLGIQLQALTRRPAAVLCYSQVAFFRTGQLPTQSPQWLPRSRALFALKLCFQNPITHSSVMFRRSVLEKTGTYSPADLHVEDYGLWGRMIEHGETVGLGKTLVHFRLHESSVSRLNQLSQPEAAHRIALEHCQKFLRLSPPEAARACAILRQPRQERKWGDWRWLLSHCIPRARWKSLEFGAWLASQSYPRRG